MITCHPSNSTTTTNFSMIGQRTSTTLQLFHKIRWNFRHFRPLYPHKFGPNLAVSSSLGPLFAAAAAVGSSTHAAVTSTITQVAVTAVAIVSGACLSTKVDFLWPKSHDQPSMFHFPLFGSYFFCSCCFLALVNVWWLYESGLY